VYDAVENKANKANKTKTELLRPVIKDFIADVVQTHDNEEVGMT
jgi:hypothetical protein